MGRILRRRIALAVALAAVLAGGTAVALGATGGDKGHDHRARLHHHFGTHHHGGALRVAGAYLGLDPRVLREQLRSGKSLAQIANSMPGKSEAGLVAALLTAAKARLSTRGSALEAHVKKLVSRTPRVAGQARAHGARRAVVRMAVLSYLGIKGHDLIQQLRAGKTLAEIADAAPGKSAAGLSDVIVKALTAKVNAAATANHLDKKAQAAHLARLRERVSHLLARTHFGGHHGGSRTSAPAG